MQNSNPLFPGSGSDDKPADPGYILPRADPPVAPVVSANSANAALNFIREKLERIYAEEPDPLAEAREAEAVQSRSKHQQFMRQLSTSGKGIAEIQTAWHEYYVALPEAEKHQVWQEFYASSNLAKHPRPSVMQHYEPPRSMRSSHASPLHAAPTVRNGVTVSQAASLMPPDTRTPKQIRERILHTVSGGGRLKAKHHFQSLAFGLSVGMATLVIFLFGFFNEVVIAPFIQPGRASATPIIVDPSSVAAGSTPEIIIPKINLEIPADYSQTSTDEAAIENALENGIVHYPSTVMPGQVGNAAFFGHSSNNIFNPGKYKFAFVLLHELVAGDTFYITYSGKAYVYKVFSTRIVDPNEVSVLEDVPEHNATATLITCDPPGTSLHRLVVVGDQISPDPSTNTGGDNTSASLAGTSTQLPDNGPSLLQRIWDAIF